MDSAIVEMGERPQGPWITAESGLTGLPLVDAAPSVVRQDDMYAGNKLCGEIESPELRPFGRRIR